MLVGINRVYNYFPLEQKLQKRLVINIIVQGSKTSSQRNCDKKYFFVLEKYIELWFQQFAICSETFLHLSYIETLKGIKNTMELN